MAINYRSQDREEELQSEIMILLDARASALDRKYFEAMKRPSELLEKQSTAARGLEQQLQTGSACHEEPFFFK